MNSTWIELCEDGESEETVHDSESCRAAGGYL